MRVNWEGNEWGAIRLHILLQHRLINGLLIPPPGGLGGGRRRRQMPVESPAYQERWIAGEGRKGGRPERDQRPMDCPSIKRGSAVMILRGGEHRLRTANLALHACFRIIYASCDGGDRGWSFF